MLPPLYVNSQTLSPEHSHQEDYYAFATLTLRAQELAADVAKNHQIEWNPENVGTAFRDQVTFVGIYDGYVRRRILLAQP
jgi:protein phosphatase PTC6